MANVKITDLAVAATPLAGTELFETVQSGSSKKVAASAIGNSATAVPYASLAGRATISSFSNTDQTGSTVSATAIKLENTVFSAGISIANDGGGNPTRITFTVAGTYALAPSLQFKNTDTSDHDATFWFRKSGTNITNSASVVNVPKAADGGAMMAQIVFYEQVTAGQFIEIMWLPENVAVTLDFTAAGGIAPAIPSVILAAERIA